MTTTPESTADHSRRTSRRRYDRVLGIVGHQTNAVQGPLVSRATVLTVASYADLEAGPVRRSLRAAVANDDLLEHAGRYCRTDPDSLRAAIEETVEADGPTDKALVATANALLEADR